MGKSKKKKSALDYPYVLDTVEYKLHVSTCAIGQSIPKAHRKGFDTFKSAIQHSSQVCDCCADALKSWNDEAAFVYNALSARKTVHTRECRVVSRIDSENLRTFQTLIDANRCGYHMCSICDPLGIQYKREAEQIVKYSRENNLDVKLHEGIIHIISRHDCWRIITEGRNNQMFLYHRNRNKWLYKKDTSAIPSFYRQMDCKVNTILGYLEYIVKYDTQMDPVYTVPKEHEHYNPSHHQPKIKKSKRGSNQYAKKRKAYKRKQTKRVIAIIEEMEAARK